MIKQIITTVSWSILSFISSLFSFGSPGQIGDSQIKSPVSSPSAYTQSQKAQNPVEVASSGVKYSVYWIEVKDMESVNFFPNFKEKSTVSEIIMAKGCRTLTNGSFYTKDNKPIGLFVSQGWKTSNAYFNPLFNGYFSVANNLPYISEEPPTDDIKIAIQSGPLLMESGKIKILKIRNDKTARRITLSITPDKGLVFAAFYDPQNNLQGPYLTDLPKYLNEFKITTGLKITDSINLDGGSASAFYNGDFFLSEFNPIGSYFCIR